MDHGAMASYLADKGNEVSVSAKAETLREKRRPGCCFGSGGRIFRNRKCAVGHEEKRDLGRLLYGESFV